MKCWRCGKEIDDGTKECIYCHTGQGRSVPATDVGKALRQIYDHYGADAVFSNPVLLANGLGDVIGDTLSVNIKKLKNQFRTAIDVGIGRLYIEQLAIGKAEDAFDNRIRKLLTEDADLSEKAANELIAFFDEMIGWKGSPILPDNAVTDSVIDEDGLSLFILGYTNEMGYGVLQSDQKALMYYKQAAEKGLSFANYILGLKYENGKSVEKSIPTAIRYYQKAADLGYETARKKVNELETRPKEMALDFHNKTIDRTLSKRLSVGDSVGFGRYDQDGTGVKKEIEWQVLAVEDGRALLLSKNGLDVRKYHSSVGGIFNKITWKKCDLRIWLNGTFYDTAFSKAEKTRIREVVNNNLDNPEYHTKGGDETKEKVFLLSIDEVQKHLPTNATRQCKATAYAIKDRAYVDNNGYTWWWLRSPGYTNNDAAYVSSAGDVSIRGRDLPSVRGVVRPALWLIL